MVEEKSKGGQGTEYNFKDVSYLYTIIIQVAHDGCIKVGGYLSCEFNSG